MRVLFAILVIACAGLLWATIAAAQHIREIRRRQRSRKVAAAPALSVSVPVNRTMEAPSTPRLARAKQLQSHF